MLTYVLLIRAGVKNMMYELTCTVHSLSGHFGCCYIIEMVIHMYAQEHGKSYVRIYCMYIRKNVLNFARGFPAMLLYIRYNTCAIQGGHESRNCVYIYVALTTNIHKYT